MSSYTDLENPLRHERGSVLAETAVLLPAFILLIFGLYDMYHVSSSLVSSHVEARNAAWKGEAGGTLSALMKIAKFNGEPQDVFDAVMQTEHGVRTDTVQTLLLPRVTTRAQVWIDRYVWSVDIGIDDLVNKMHRLFDDRDDPR